MGPSGIFRGDLASVERLEGFWGRFKEDQYSLLVESEHAVAFLNHGPVFSELFVGGPFSFSFGEVNTVEFLVATVQVDVPVDEGGVETHKRLNPGDDGEGDRFRNQREGYGQTGEKVVLGVRTIPEFAIDELDHTTCRSIVETPGGPGIKARFGPVRRTKTAGILRHLGRGLRASNEANRKSFWDGAGGIRDI